MEHAAACGGGWAGETGADRAMAGPPSRRRFLACAAVLATGGCASGRRARTGPVRTAPLVYDDRGGLFVAARVEGGARVRFLLDTGASRSALAPAFASRLGLAVRAGGEVEGSAGVVQAGRAAATVEVEGLGPVRADFTVYEFGSYDPDCVGILGHEYLCRAPFQVRYRDRSLVWNAQLPGRTQPLSIAGGIPRITVLAGGRPLDLRIDTGAAFPPGPDAYVNVTEDQAASLGLTGEPVAVFTATGTGNAVLRLPVHRLPGLTVGGRDFDRAFAIVQPRVGYFARPDAVGFLGNAVLDKLDPFLDYAGGAFAVGT
jgi:predicted aspartyl protease